MKKIIITLSCFALAIGIASTSSATPVPDVNANTDKILSLNNSIVPLDFTLSKSTGVSFAGLSSEREANASAPNAVASTRNWTPRWASLSNWSYSKSRSFNSWRRKDKPRPRPTSPVPEPATIFLLGSGLVGLALMRRKKMKN